MKRASIQEINETRNMMLQDERCIQVDDKANAKASKIMNYLLLISLFIVAINDFQSLATLIIASLCVIKFGLVAYYYHKYNKIN